MTFKAPAVKLPGVLIIAVDSILMQLSPVMRPGMEKFDPESDKDKANSRLNKWDRGHLRKTAVDECFYKLHPEALQFLKCFWWRPGGNRWDDSAKSADVANFDRSGTAHSELIIKQAWTKTHHGTITGYLNHTDGWVMVSPLPATSPFVMLALKDLFRRFDTRVVGLSKKRVKELTSILLDGHYIQFSGFDAKGNPNPLAPLVPRIAEALEKPRYPNEELEALLKEHD